MTETTEPTVTINDQIEMELRDRITVLEELVNGQRIVLRAIVLLFCAATLLRVLQLRKAG